MDELQIFNNPEFGDIRAVEIDGEPWFVAADVCRILDIGNPSQAMTRLDDDEKTTLILNEGAREMNMVNEPGLYTLVLGSRKPEVKPIKRWLAHDVIPAIRKHGAYIAPNAQLQSIEAAVLQAVVQPITAALEALTGVVQAMSQRLDGLEQGRNELKALPPMPEKNPFDDNPFAEDRPRPSSILARKLWMKLVSEKLELLSTRFGKSNNAILHKIYQDMEEHFETVMDEERCRVMEEQRLEKCSVLLAIFFDPELRDYFQRTVDYNLAPENRGW